MCRFLFCTIPALGHVNPGLPIARLLVQRGHEVRWYTGRHFRPAIEATGARFEPMAAVIDPADQSFEQRFPERAKLTGLAAFRFDLKHLFIDDVQMVISKQPVLAIPGYDVQKAATAWAVELN